ncbi:Nif11 family protein [Sorangium sp. So ce131]|uniref:Nif11 family protein n=1 Tax=Sorangium sp. So ce131 TaxID=3133282 RepID=UPI003F600E65
MSQSRVEEFFIRARSDVALLARLGAAADIAMVVRIAREEGFAFSADDLAEAAPRFRPGGLALEERRQARDAARALAVAVAGRAAGDTVYLMPEGGGGGTGDPPPVLEDITVLSFRVTPPSIRPRSGGAEISWSLDVPAGLHADITLNDAPVGPSGSMRDDPVASKTYWLAASRPGATRILGWATLGVDNTGCTDDDNIELSLIQTLSAHTAFVAKGFREGVSYDVSGITVVATMGSLSDLTVVEDGGLVLFTLNLSLAVAGIPGGSVSTKVWVRPFAHDGAVEHFVDRSDTSYVLPAAAWALAIFGGPTAITLTAAIRELIRRKIDPLVRDAIDGGSSVIDGFFHNVISVAVVPASGDGGASIRAVIRKKECL